MEELAIRLALLVVLVGIAHRQAGTVLNLSQLCEVAGSPLR